MSSPSSPKVSFGRRLASWVILAALVVTGALVWNNRDVVADQFRLIGYTPPADVSTLASNIRFTGEGQRLFYASHPEIEGKADFNKSCGNTEVHATVLGCYTNYSIYVYDVTDTRLNGVQEVTAAHETLHAAYARLSDGERSKVDAMLQRQYDSMKNDTAFNQRFAVYNDISQAEKLNELHSILGTEVTPLSSELETYYSQYFTDRNVVTSYYKDYEGQFDTLKQRQDDLGQRITALKAQIDDAEAQYETDRQSLNQDIRQFNERAANRYYSSQTQFNADRADLEDRSASLNQTAASINSDIDQYNDLIKQYNDVSIQTQDLQNSLDSNSVQSAPSV